VPPPATDDVVESAIDTANFQESLFRLVDHYLKIYALRNGERDELHRAMRAAQRDVAIIFGRPRAKTLDDWLAEAADVLPAGASIEVRSPEEAEQHEADSKARLRFAGRRA
jgi:hypothetical protein